jgi:flavin reductase (DIM6/NTAB) family NADH-FMN oxidoreductase RutF/DNA-binding IclR family transcriptional regulator
MKPTQAPVDGQWFRRVMGQYPTGVCVVTGSELDGSPAGMSVGSFTSVSLNPPLVAFFPDRTSTSWNRIRATGQFCVNILSADQEAVCRRFASRRPDKFDGIGFHRSKWGLPILNDSVAWVDCEIHSVAEAGDHDIVLGKVRELAVQRVELPLLFFRGGYGRFTPLSLADPKLPGAVSEQLFAVERARSQMDTLSRRLSAGVIATVRVGDEIVTAAIAGVAERHTVSVLVGQRFPFMPPSSSIFAAWLTEAEVEAYIQRKGEESTESVRAALQVVREREFSVGLVNDAQRKLAHTLAEVTGRRERISPIELQVVIRDLHYDPPELTSEVERSVRLIHAPVFDSAGRVLLAVTIYDFPRSSEAGHVTHLARELLGSVQEITRLVGGKWPARQNSNS